MSPARIFGKTTTARFDMSTQFSAISLKFKLKNTAKESKQINVCQRTEISL